MSFASLRASLRSAPRSMVSVVALALTLAAASPAALAIGAVADINVLDRSTGQLLPVYTHEGRYYVAGRPGARYAVRVHNRAASRVMTVVAVDGVNVVSGDSASWEQNGYVLASWQRHDIAGWRKSQAEVAAFEFTALPNSYAARTGRPDNVGVIGVAVFRERPAPQVQAPMPQPRPYAYGGAAGNATDHAAGPRAEAPAADAATASSSTSAPAAARKSAEGVAGDGARALSRPAPQPESKLGTGHGARENAWVQYTNFERAQATPDEVITIYYDSRDNLIAQGVIPAPRIGRHIPVPQAFPVAPQLGFVPDPPRM